MSYAGFPCGVNERPVPQSAKIEGIGLSVFDDNKRNAIIILFNVTQSKYFTNKNQRRFHNAKVM